MLDTCAIRQTLKNIGESNRADKGMDIAQGHVSCSSS